MMPDVVDPRLELSTWLHDELVSRDALERERWALERVAREIAHHDCGHLALFSGWSQWMPRASATAWIAALTAILEFRAYGAEKEAQADIYALQLCVDAGYEDARCVQALEILENLSLDVGDIDGVFGPEHLLDPTDPEQGGRSYQFQRWLWTRRRGYLPRRERRERAKSFCGGAPVEAMPRGGAGPGVA